MLTGFKKGLEMCDKNFAQGVCILQIYKLDMEDAEKPLNRIYYKELSDYDYEYYPVKNMKPITFNGNAIWFFVFDNNSNETTITRTLYKYDMSPDREDPTVPKGEIVIDSTVEQKPVLQDPERLLVGASVSFSSAVPRGREIGETEFKASCFATFYYMATSAMPIVNPVNGKVLRSERYSTHITRRLSELDIPASYTCE